MKKRLPMRIIKTVISVMVAIALLQPFSQYIFSNIIMFYPFVSYNNEQLTTLGMTNTALFFTGIAASRAVGNTIGTTWQAIRNQLIANMFGTIFALFLAETIGQVFGNTNAIVVGLGLFLLFITLKHLKLNETFVLAAVTYMSILMLSIQEYPALIRGFDRMYSMAFGLIIAGLVNILFISPKISLKKLLFQFENFMEMTKLSEVDVDQKIIDCNKLINDCNVYIDDAAIFLIKGSRLAIVKEMHFKLKLYAQTLELFTIVSLISESTTKDELLLLINQIVKAIDENLLNEVEPLKSKISLFTADNYRQIGQEVSPLILVLTNNMESEI